MSQNGAPPEPGQVGSEHPVREIVDRLEDCAQAEDVSLRDLVKAFGTASFVSTMMVPALLVVSPLSGIPFFSSVCGLTIAFIATQMMFKRTHLYLPDALTRRTISGQKLRTGLQKMRGFADFLDRHTHKGRLRGLVGNGGRIVPQLLCVVAGLLMPLLEIVPFSSSVLGLSVLSFSIALLTRDGAFVLVGLAIVSGAAAVPFFVLQGG